MDVIASVNKLLIKLLSDTNTVGAAAFTTGSPCQDSDLNILSIAGDDDDRTRSVISELQKFCATAVCKFQRKA